MPRPKFNKDEFNTTGKMYPGINMKLMGMQSIPETPVLNRPITPLENFRLLFEGKKPYWIPVTGWTASEVNQFRPRINPDNIANHQVFDGGPPIAFETLGDVIHSDWFDLDWHWVESVGGATVQPGNPKIPDITEWEKYVSIPDIDAMDWDSCAKQNVEYLGSNKMNQLGIQCGLWERLMAAMDVVEASLALYEDDQKPAVHRFFDEYSRFLIAYIGRMADVCNIHSVVLHEDWAHQRGPFMAPELAREMLLPYIQRIVDYVHSRGMSYEIHCCGDCSMLIPIFIETGADLWSGQRDLNDLEGYAKKYKDSRVIFGIAPPDIGPEVSENDMRKAAREWVEEFRDCRITVSFRRPAADGAALYHPGLQNAIYEFSRLTYQDE